MDEEKTQRNIRIVNKSLGHLCGNCKYAGEVRNPKLVKCKHPIYAKYSGALSWFRKTKGGCKRWIEKEDKQC